MNSCFHTSPIIPKCNIGSIQYFGLRTGETFRKQSTDTFMLPENSSQNTPEPANDRPWEQAPDWTPKEKFWAVMGVLKATLAIAGVYLVGLGVLLAVLFLLWK